MTATPFKVVCDVCGERVGVVEDDSYGDRPRSTARHFVEAPPGHRKSRVLCDGAKRYLSEKQHEDVEHQETLR